MFSSSTRDSSDLETSKDNCSNTLLIIVASGSAIVTEINRLVELIPRPFKQGCNYYLDKEKKFTLDNIVCDFNYFKNSEEFELRIESCVALKNADEEFCDQYSDLLTRFYLTFESIQRYASDLNKFIADLEEELFVGQSLDTFLIDTENLQLLCEAYFILGLMLLTVDNNFDGNLRERLIVAHYRYSIHRTSPDYNIDETCNLLRSTGYKSLQQQSYRQRTGDSTRHIRHQPPNYPENYFSRAQVNQSVVNLLIAKLQSLDIYNQTSVIFPQPIHRSNALAQQASILYVLLYFCPSILKTQSSRMREITDKFFYDNWVINVSMGELVNLLEAWEPYKAARESLMQIIDIESVKGLTNQFNLRFYRMAKQIRDYLQEGFLDETTFLENHTKILNAIREGNVVLRWMLLHSQLYQHWNSKLSRTVHWAVIENQPDTNVLCNLLQDLSSLERISSHLFDEIFRKKQEKLSEHKAQALDILDELVAVYGDERPMRWIKVGTNLNLSRTLAKSRSNLNDLDLTNAQSRPALIKLVNNIESAREVYSDSKSLQIVQLFAELRTNLLILLKYLSLSENLLVVIQSAGDFSYAWRLMDEKFTYRLQCIIKKDPLKIKTIETIFLKLASAYDVQLLRIQQVNAQGDLTSVTQYYSAKLVAYIRDVLHVIPATILELVGSIISIQTNNLLGEMPSKIQLDNLKAFSLHDQRSQMLELTYKISHYAEGIKLMQNTSIGLVRIDSKQLLEDGIRRELVQKLSESIQSTLTFTPVKDQSTSEPISNELVNGQLLQQASNLKSKLEQLSAIINGYKCSFEYIQDYLFIYGLRMWQEELSRLVNFNLEQASFALMDGQSLASLEVVAQGSKMGSGDSRSVSGDLETMQYQSRYQSKKAPIPIYDRDPLQSSFIVRILQELLQITNPKATIYNEQTNAWYDQRAQHQQMVDLKVFELICSCLSVAGLNGLDELCCTLLMLELQRVHACMLELCWPKQQQNQSAKNPLQEALQALCDDLREAQPRGGDEDNERQLDEDKIRRNYSRHVSRALSRVMQPSERLLNQLARIGQLQAIRVSISCVLSTKCRYEARHLYACLETLNTTLISTLKQPMLGSDKRGPNQQMQADGSGEKNADDSQQRLTATSSSQRLSSNIDDSQLVFELANHLEWIGLQNPLDKIYTLNLQQQQLATRAIDEQQPNDQLALLVNLLFLLLLGQSSKFMFSRSIGALLPSTKQVGRGECQFDALPLFYGITTLLNHYEPLLGAGAKQATATLLQLMSYHIKLTLTSGEPTANTNNNLTLESANLITSIIELARLSGCEQDELFACNHLPKYIIDTFQFTVCHLG